MYTSSNTLMIPHPESALSTAIEWTKKINNLEKVRRRRRRKWLTPGAERWRVSYVSPQVAWFFKRNGLRPPRTVDDDGFLIHLAGNLLWLLVSVEDSAPFIVILLMMMVASFLSDRGSKKNMQVWAPQDDSCLSCCVEDGWCSSTVGLHGMDHYPKSLVVPERSIVRHVDQIIQRAQTRAEEEKKNCSPVNFYSSWTILL